ncbi:MAG: hypothetical protein FD181_3666 [Prolixibacteraceae bacterium]|nr:MAG: hypothetical protein FD181_3666 [Prolixibacteraceae bacterium]
MKNLVKIQVLTVILVSVFFVAIAQQSTQLNQSKEKRNIWFGLRAGTDLLSPTTDFEEIKTQLNSNMQFGAFAKIGKKLFIQPEVYGNFLVEDNFNTKKIVANSVRVPVLLGFEFLNLRVASAHLMAGPMVNFYVNPFPDKKYDYKLQLGGGIELLRFLSLDVRYAVNLTDNIKNELKQLAWKGGVNVTLGIQFR